MTTVAQALASEVVDSAQAWWRLLASLALITLGSSGMYAVVVVLPAVQAEFGVARADASLPYTLTMIGFGVGTIVMGRLADRFGVVVPVLPVPLVATVLLRDPARALSVLELKGEVLALMRSVEAAGSHVYVPRGDRDYAIDVGLRMLTLRHMVVEEEGVYRANPNELQALQYYANSIAHLCQRLDQAAQGREPP